MKATGGRRRFAWLVIGGLTAAMIVCGVMLMRLAAQPHWSTYRFPADPKTGIAVAFDYPDTWVLQNIPNGRSRAFANQHMGFANLQLCQPTGLAKWWEEHILRHTSQQPIQPQIGFLVMSNQPPNQINMLEQAYKAQGRFAMFTSSVVARVKHPLGPAIKVDIVYNIPQRGVQKPQHVRIHQFMIEPDEPRLKNQTVINIHYVAPTGAFPGGENRLQEIVRRIHLVNTAGGTTK